MPLAEKKLAEYSTAPHRLILPIIGNDAGRKPQPPRYHSRTCPTRASTWCGSSASRPTCMLLLTAHMSGNRPFMQGYGQSFTAGLSGQCCRVSAKARTPSVSIAVPAMFNDSNLDCKRSKVQKNIHQTGQGLSDPRPIQGSKHGNIYCRQEDPRIQGKLGPKALVKQGATRRRRCCEQCGASAAARERCERWTGTPGGPLS